MGRNSGADQAVEGGAAPATPGDNAPGLMLLTLTTTHRPATDLGYLFQKHPARLHTFELSCGTARAFDPDANAERCTAALLLDVDPVGLVRN